MRSIQLHNSAGTKHKLITKQGTSCRHCNNLLHLYHTKVGDLRQKVHHATEAQESNMPSPAHQLQNLEEPMLSHPPNHHPQLVRGSWSLHMPIPISQLPRYHPVVHVAVTDNIAI